jgi:hypothetical protein
MTETPEPEGSLRYAEREVVGVCANAQVLDEAIERLGMAGIDRAAISVLAVSGERSGRMKAFYDSAAPIVVGDALQKATYVSQDSQTEGKVVAIAVPFQIGGFAGAWAVAAVGGALVTALAGALVVGAIGAGLGAIVFHAVARHHAPDIHNKLVQGGFALWVSTPEEWMERSAIEVLHRCGATSVHTHTALRTWGIADSPMSGVQPDPFLEHDPIKSAPASL